MQAIAERFTHDVNTLAHAHPERKQGQTIATNMFDKGMGKTRERINDFHLSPGHVLSYTLLAMQAKLQTITDPQQRLATHREFTSSVLTALTHHVREGQSKPCDTRGVEELAQLVEVFDLAKLPPSAALMLELGLPTATQCLARILADNPHLAQDPTEPEQAKEIAAQAQAALHTAFQAEMIKKIPGASPAVCATFLQEKILPGWQYLKDRALDNTPSSTANNGAGPSTLTPPTPSPPDPYLLHLQFNHDALSQRVSDMLSMQYHHTPNWQASSRLGYTHISPEQFTHFHTFLQQTALNSPHLNTFIQQHEQHIIGNLALFIRNSQ